MNKKMNGRMNNIYSAPVSHQKIVRSFLAPFLCFLEA